jgi:predicted ATPase/DNA-binding transcriptional regulator YiaG/Tfp pilus assembly protein PilF
MASIMGPTAGAEDSPSTPSTALAAPDRPPWPAVLRALREARGVTQDGWAALLGVSRKTVQRWERGARAPDPGAEGALLRYCREAGLLRAYARGPLAGPALTEAGLRDLLAEARWRGPARGEAPAPEPPGAAPEPNGAAGAAPEAPHPGPPAELGAAPETPGQPEPGAAPAPESPVPPTNLPVALTSFVGRARELAAVRRVQAGTRLLTLSGPGGGGKTRLALALAAELPWAYPHGIWFVDLAPLAEPALLPEVVAAALKVRTTAQQPPAAALLEALRARQLLLLLDNCEHLLAACADLAEALLRACPHLEVLATSREPLGIPGETVWRVPPLTVPPAAPDMAAPKAGAGDRPPPLPPGAVDAPPELGTTDAERLFVARARLRRPEFAPTPADAAAIAEICRRLDGIPLAIELAAARVGVLSAAQLADRLGDRFRLLTGGARAAPTRQQTLRATLDWSYDLLTPSERALLRTLSAFAGGFTLEAAEVVGSDVGSDGGSRQFAGGGEDLPETGDSRPTGDSQGLPAASSQPATEPVLDLLARLVEKSLVLADEQGEVVRYRLLETVRQYAAELLERSGEAPRARAAHARYFLDLVEQPAPAGGGTEQARRHAQLETEHDNLRATLAWAVQQGNAERALRLASALRWFWYRRRHWDDGLTWPARALALPGAQERTPLRAEVLEGAGLFGMLRDPTAAQTLFEESIAINLELGRLSRTAQTEAFLAWLHIRRWRLDEARTRAAAALARTEAGDSARASALALLAAVDARRGDYAAARARYEEALALRRVSGRSLLLLDMAKAAFLAGDGTEARARAEEALRTAREAGINHAVEEELRLIVRVALTQGDLAAAAARAAELVADVRGQGQGPGAEADALALAGQVAQASGDPAGAAARYRAALELARRLPDPGEHHPLLYRDVGDPPGMALALEGTAGLCAPAAAALALRLAGAAAALRERARQPLTAPERAALDRALAAAREHLGPDEAAQAWAAGRAAPIENVMALALEALAAMPQGPER